MTVSAYLTRSERFVGAGLSVERRSASRIRADSIKY